MANIIIVSGASGSGKTSLIRATIESIDNLTLSISHTTRPKRPNEVNGTDYYFCSKAQFQQDVKDNLFAEYALVFDNHYGTQKSFLAKAITDGMDIIVEIDWQGAQQIRSYFDNTISISIMPPSLSALEERLTKRGQDNPETITRRMQDAQLEMSHYKEYDYIIINKEFDSAQTTLKAIIEAKRVSLNNQSKHIQAILSNQ